MNIRRGLERALFAFVLPWACYWGWVYWQSSQEERQWEENRAQWSAKMTPDDGTALDRPTLKYILRQVSAASDLSFEARNKKELAIIMGLFVPGVLTVFTLLLVWVYRGFRRAS